MKTSQCLFTVIVLAVATSVHAQSAVSLGTAADYGILAATGITNTGATSVVGNIGVYSGTSITGFFGTTANEGPGTFTGQAHQGNPTAQQAQLDALAGYTALNNLSVNTLTVSSSLGGQTLSSGVYELGAAEITDVLTLDGAGDYVFQIDSTLITAASSSIVFRNGADAANVYWAVGSSATLGIDSEFAGTIIALTSVTMTNGASVDGRVFALEGAVTMNNNTVIPEPSVMSLMAFMATGLIVRRRRIS